MFYFEGIETQVALETLKTWLDTAINNLIYLTLLEQDSWTW